MSKSRGDRGKTPAQAPPPQTLVVNEVIPGRLTENDWGLMLDDETADDFMADILNEVLNKALDAIFQKIIDSRIIPYAVDTARIMMLQLVEWRFLERDIGDSQNETVTTWLDEEPKPGVIDSWAQGAVPVVNEILKEVSVEGVKDDSDKDVKNNLAAVPDEENSDDTSVVNIEDISSEPIQDENGLELKTEEENEDTEDVIEELASKPQDRKGTFVKPEPPKPGVPSNHIKRPPARAFKRYKGKLPDFRQITLTPVTESRPMLGEHVKYDGRVAVPNSLDATGKPQYGRPPGTKEVTFDERGNVVVVQKLKVEKLPSHRVKTQYTIVDPVEEDLKAKLANKKQRYNFVKNGRTIKGNRDAHKLHHIHHLPPPSHPKGAFQGASLPMPLVDLMNVSKGVSVNEGGILKKGASKQSMTYAPTLGRLQPLASSTAGLSLSPRDIVSESSPVVRLVELNPSPLPTKLSAGGGP